MEHNGHTLSIFHRPGREPRPAQHIPAVTLPELPPYPGDGATDPDLAGTRRAWEEARAALAAWQTERECLNESRYDQAGDPAAVEVRRCHLQAGLVALEQLRAAAAGALPELRQSWDAQRQIADRTPPSATTPGMVRHWRETDAALSTASAVVSNIESRRRGLQEALQALPPVVVGPSGQR